MASHTSLVIAFCLSLGLALPATASSWAGLFDVEDRAAKLQTPAYNEIRALCLAVAIDHGQRL